MLPLGFAELGGGMLANKLRCQLDTDFFILDAIMEFLNWLYYLHAVSGPQRQVLELCQLLDLYDHCTVTTDTEVRIYTGRLQD